MKTVIVIFSDPNAGTEEALGRLLNGLFLAIELKEKHQDVSLVFQGAGARWPGLLSKPDHPANPLYEAILDHAIICGGCADAFGATAQAELTGVMLVRERQIPGTTGVIDLSRYLDEGARLVTF